MKKQIPALLLALALALPLPTSAAQPAQADPMAPLFDLDPDRSPDARPWYDYESIRICVEQGLMQGTDYGFKPARPITLAEVAVLCARIHSQETGAPIPTGESWYGGAIELLLTLAGDAPGPWEALQTTPKAPATRLDFARLLDLVWGADAPQYNDYTALPDTEDAAVLRLYNAGILTGTDALGSFVPWRGLTRAEVAAMAARVAQPTLRKGYVPPEETPVPTGTAQPDPVETAPTVPSEPPAADHDHDERSAALEQLAAYLSRRSGRASADDRDAFCTAFGLDPHAPLLTLPYDGSLSACELLPFFVTIIDVQMTGVAESRGLSREEFWSGTFRSPHADDILPAGEYLKSLLKDGVCESLLVLQGADRSGVAALREALAESQAFRDLDPQALYEFAALQYPQILDR